MPRVKSRSLYDLIKSMNKNEKRYFRLQASASQQAEDKKMMTLFDHINKQDDFDEDSILKKEPTLKPEQLSNLKAYLYEKILQSIRQFNAGKMMDIRIREQIDYAQLLFDRRLYGQGLSCLKKAKKMAQTWNNLELQLEIIKLEKSALMQNISGDISKVDTLITEVRTLNSQINNISTFSNSSIKLNSFYARIGYIRNAEDYQQAKNFFSNNIPDINESQLSTLEQIHLFRLYIAYYFFVQDFQNGYIYAKKLGSLFDEQPDLIETNIDEYLKALNNLLIAQYKLFKYHDFILTNQKMESIATQAVVKNNENLRVRLLKYHYIHEINEYFMTGEFTKGVNDIMQVHRQEVEDLILTVDHHSAMILNYKVACLYLGAGDFRNAVRWLNNIINIHNIDIREDLHCFARIINLICHYELGNFDVIKYYIISTYRFLLKKDDLHMFQKYILTFLKNLTNEVSQKELIERFKTLKAQLIPLMDSEYDKRAFIYFDIITWLVSKIEKREIEEIIQEKFIERMKLDI